ncbi:TonB C-terminal domain-containing protein [Pseudomonas huanghezhanensis]|uniref:TonB C-terminal domain-containing protein n=1 Tax=Pseudomonas huanghezhanensis TaxID=3002903 RepID=UPI0022856F79|nr:TonB C-terminal domain-containing protein [Pseudomonas sp. BSw22131]
MNTETSQPNGSPLRFLKWGVAVLVLAGATWVLWQWAHDMSGVRREAPKIPAIIPLPPPPPPKDPEPPVEEKIVTPAPQPEPEPVKPQEAPPSPAADLANPMQMDGDPQSGGDSFNIGAGKGGGMGGGGGGGNGTYNQYLAFAFQRALRDNPDVRNLAFRLQADIWLSAGGEITRVELAKTSGDAKTDELVLNALRTTARLQERPPSTITLPLRIDLSGRRPG